MRAMIRVSSLFPFLVLACVSRTQPAAAQAVGPEFRVNSYTTQNQQRPRIATGASGSFVVVWDSGQQDNGMSFGVFGQRYDSAGAPLGAEFLVNTVTANDQRSPAVASDSGGSFVVVWDSYFQDGSGSGVFGQRYDSTGAPLGAEFRVNIFTEGSQSRPSVGSDSSGNFIVAWQSGYPGSIFGRRFASSGAPLGGEFRVNTYTSSTQHTPSVSSDAAGNFVVVWLGFTQDGSGYGVFGQRFDMAGVPLGGEFLVNTYTTNWQVFPSVASDLGGNFIVVWESPDASGYGIFGQRYSSAGAPLGTEFRVNTSTSNSQDDPAVASDSAGNFVVVWMSISDGSSEGVFAQRYDSAGTPLGGEFLVNTFTQNAQYGPSVASDSAAHFIVVWTSTSQDGFGYGIFGQRFCRRPLTSAVIGVSGSSEACPNSTGGIATVSDTGGGLTSHQWGYRTTSTTGMILPLSGQIAAMYTINGSDFPAAGTYFLVCTTTPECGGAITSNEATVTVDVTPPGVTPPSALTTTQSLCM